MEKLGNSLETRTDSHTLYDMSITLNYEDKYKATSQHKSVWTLTLSRIKCRERVFYCVSCHYHLVVACCMNCVLLCIVIIIYGVLSALSKTSLVYLV